MESGEHNECNPIDLFHKGLLPVFRAYFTLRSGRVVRTPAVMPWASDFHPLGMSSRQYTKSPRRIQVDGGGGGIYAAVMLARRRLRRSQRQVAVGTIIQP